jgi:hypothetical protein
VDSSDIDWVTADGAGSSGTDRVLQLMWHLEEDEQRHQELEAGCMQG